MSHNVMQLLTFSLVKITSIHWTLGRVSVLGLFYIVIIIIIMFISGKHGP